jgi:thioredoxin 1
LRANVPEPVSELLVYTESFSMGVPEFDDGNFESEVLQADGPVLVDFWAPWCGPCRMIAPVVEELASENAGSVKVGKLNVDEAPLSAQSYGVNSIPTLVLFKNGEVVDRFVGVQPKSRLQQAIDSVTA